MDNEPTTSIPAMPFPMVHATTVALRDRREWIRAQLGRDEGYLDPAKKTNDLEHIARLEKRIADLKYQLKQCSDALNIFTQLRPTPCTR